MSADDRRSFLARLTSRSNEVSAHTTAHPMAERRESLPPVVSLTLDPDDLPGTFTGAARAIGATVHVVETSAALGAIARDIVERHGVRRAVASKQRDVWPVVEALGALGVEVSPVDRASATDADLGVSAASAGIAATGSVAQASDDVGGRVVSLLPRVHWCIVPASRIVASTLEFFVDQRERRFPSNVVLITGPSKSADIEQIIVTGVHGPVALEISVVLDI